MRLVPLLMLLALPACDGSKTADDKSWITATRCKSDKNCGDGFICKEGPKGQKICQKGERTAEEKAAVKKAEAAAAAKNKKKKDVVKPGEGRLHFRICPGFKNTPESIGTVIAVHQETKKRHVMHLALVVSDGGWETQFKFASVPLGVYDVTAAYGIQVKGRPETTKLKCDPKAKPCRDELIREITVVTPDKDPPPKLSEKGKTLHKDCDFIAE